MPRERERESAERVDNIYRAYQAKAQVKAWVAQYVKFVKMQDCVGRGAHQEERGECRGEHRRKENPKSATCHLLTGGDHCFKQGLRVHDGGVFLMQTKGPEPE